MIFFSCEVSSFNALSRNSHVWEAFFIWWTTWKRLLSTLIWLKPMKLLHYGKNVIWKITKYSATLFNWHGTQHQYRKTFVRLWKKEENAEERMWHFTLLTTGWLLFGVGREIIDAVLSSWETGSICNSTPAWGALSWNVYLGEFWGL